MSPAAALHAQLASIVEVLANAAVAEICELVDSGYSVLQTEISRSRKENEVLRRKLRLMELRATRAAALRAATAACGTAAARARPPAGNEPRRHGTTRGEAALPNRETPPTNRGQEAAQRTTTTAAVVKVELCEETEAPPPPIKQEAGVEGGVRAQSWASGEVGSSQHLTCSRPPEPGAYDGLMYEPQLQHGAATTQNPLHEDPTCSSAGVPPGSGFALFGDQQAAPPSTDGQRLPARKEAAAAADRRAANIRRDGWRRRDGDGGGVGGVGKSFACNFCGKTLACLKNLKTHLRVHTGEKPFVCSLCGKRFSDASNLKRHQSVHTGEKRYGCVHCGKRFAQSGSLKVHMSVHTDCKQFSLS